MLFEMKQSILSLSLLICLSLSNGSQALCPDGCRCSEIHDLNNSLAINCTSRRRQGDTDRQINDFMSQEKFDNLKVLSIAGSSITKIPASICRLYRLESLSLNKNRIDSLGGTNCLNGMASLVNFSAKHNQITRLENGVFANLTKLSRVRLQWNLISEIDLNPFPDNNVLRIINLKNNKLTRLDTWPVRVSSNRYGEGRKLVRIFLTNNSISQFSNDARYQFICSTTKMFLYMEMSYNKIRHIMDLVEGWNLTLDQFKCMLRWITGIKLLRPKLDLDVAHNPIDCNCEDYQLYELEKKNFMYSHIYKDAPCETPASLANRTIREIELNNFTCTIVDRCPRNCDCFYRPKNHTLHVDCSGRNLTEFPRQLPPLPDNETFYSTFVRDNPRITAIDDRAYLWNSVVVDAVNCSIVNIADEVWQRLLMVRSVYLQHNNLTSVPDMESLTKALKTPPKIKEIGLGYNPYDCGSMCAKNWMDSWHGSNHRIDLVDHMRISCDVPHRLNNMSIEKVSAEDFCSDPVLRKLAKFGIIAASVVGEVVLVVVVVHRLRVVLFVSWNFHPFDRDECAGEHMDYDVFLSYSSDDYGQNIAQLVERLESEGYKICYPDRDFRPGDTIENNISRAIAHSKRTVCFVTVNFLRSPYCMREFEVALHHNITVLHKKRLIVLMKFPNPSALWRPGRTSSGSGGSSHHLDRCSARVTDSFRQYLRQYTYIDYTQRDWFSRLLYGLPINGMLENNVDVDESSPLLG